MTNALEDTSEENPDVREGIEVALHLLQPFLPHIAEECWAALGHADMLIQRPWPVADKALLTDDSVTIAVQINGKLRTTIALAKDMDKALVEETVLALQAVTEALKDKKINKVIVVPNRIVNVVVG